MSLKYFFELRDLRVERNREHLLEEILYDLVAAMVEYTHSVAPFFVTKLENKASIGRKLIYIRA